uniref:Pre-mRNA-splicing factor 38 n=1 Tax=Amorphochlora amoebiformis TaxID=1561963 RepID=A0A0H5BHZ9_9EUKA|nr:mRNA splicing factor PRP38 [Amorphochlora amoebiformis]
MQYFDISVTKRILNSYYWKIKCTNLDLESVLRELFVLKSVGLFIDNDNHVHPFLCLLFKFILLKPSPSFIEFLLRMKNPAFQIKTLGIFYVRLVYDSITIYKALEPLYYSFGRIAIKIKSKYIKMITYDELIYKLLYSRKFMGVNLPVITKRYKSI